MVNQVLLHLVAAGSNPLISIVGAVGSDGALGFEKGVTGLTVILGAVTFTGDLTISLGLTDAPSSI